MLIEITTFRLREGVGDSALLAADKHVQEVLSSAPGFVRRTTARGKGGEWLVLTFWDSDADCDSASEAAAELGAFIDDSTEQSERYETLD